jgi:hypothetical protein
MIKIKSEQDLLISYDQFIEFIKRVFSSNEKRLNGLLHMYSENELGTQLAIAPASGKSHFHSAYIGGYIDHVMNVAKNSYKLKKLFEEEVTVDFTDEELFFAAIHHDLGKLGNIKEPYYVQQHDEWSQKKKNEFFTQNPNIQYFDVTHRALWLLNQYGILYSEKEMLGIMLADGLYNESNKKYLISYSEDFQLKTELPYIIHWADHMSCRQEFAQYKLSK